MDDARITVVIADDHPVVRKGLRDMIDSDHRLRLLADAPDGRAAWEAICEHKPRIAVLDISMPHKSGIEIATEVRKAELPTSIVILTVFDDREICAKAIEAGALGYILKDSAAQDILRCIHRVAEGAYFISPDLPGAVINGGKADSAVSEQLSRLHLLTTTERNVLRMISRDMSTREIAAELSISPRTVERHRANIATKLKLHGSFSLLRFALDNRQKL